MTRTLSALVALTGILIKRLLREGMVMRSLAMPIVLLGGTLAITLLVVVLTRAPGVVVLSPDQSALAPVFEAHHLTTRIHANPKQQVADGLASAGTDGHTLWVAGTNRSALRAEIALREQLGSPWHYALPPLPTAGSASWAFALLDKLFIALFALYGVVFGAGMVARDRDEATLDAELALATPRWVHGAARWLAASMVLTLAVGFSLAVPANLLGQLNPWPVLRHATAAVMASTALGLVSVGQAGLNVGFSSALSVGLTATTGLLGLGMALPQVGQWLPLASATAGGSGVVPLVLAALLGPLAIALFTRRSAHT